MATNMINGKKYVGQTINKLGSRKSQHIYGALNRRGNNHFHNAIRKYGTENFDWKILHDFVLNIDDLNKLEIFYIGYYDTFENGYNYTVGGNGNFGCIPSKETRKKMSKIHKGRPCSVKTREKISKGNKGKKRSVEARQKIGEASKGRKYSKERGRKISEALSGKNHYRAKAVIINGVYFGTCKEAAVCLNVHQCTINRRFKRQVPGYEYAINIKEELDTDK
jgi:group I intron endonuclease